MALQDRAMKVALNVSTFNPKVKDQNITQKINSDFGVQQHVGDFTKNIILRDRIMTIGKIVNGARTYHRERTLPWGQNGERLLPSAFFDEYRQTMNVFKKEFDMAVNDFIANFPLYVQEAANVLQGMHNIDDYPDPSSLKGKFDFQVTITPLEDANDFRVKMSDIEAARIKGEISQLLEERQNKAMQDVYERLFKVTEHMAKKLAEPNSNENGKRSIFRNSLISNIVDLTNILPTLNIANDVKLAELSADVRSLCQYDADDLRNNDETRKQAAERAQEIVDKMAIFMGNAPSISTQEPQAA